MEEYEEKRGGNPVRRISCFILILLLICCLSITFILISKPPVVWDSVVDFNNMEIELLDDSEFSYEDAVDRIDEQIVNRGDNFVTIEEEFLSVLARESFPALKDLTILVGEDSMTLYWLIDESSNLIGAAEIRIDNDSRLYIDGLGTPRFKLPKELSNSVAGIALTYLNFGNSTNESGNLIYKILGAKDSQMIDDVKFKDGELEVNIIFEPSLYD